MSHPTIPEGGTPERVGRSLHVGWVELHPDTSLNFQLNRWLAYGGETWLADVKPIVATLGDYDAWRTAFLALGDAAERAGRTRDAALHLRAAEFFMTSSDPRKEPTRLRLLALLRRAFDVTAEHRRDAPWNAHTLPVYRFTPERNRGTIVVFGGFDSYVEEFFPILLALCDAGFDVVAFEGPGQGAVLEEQGVPMTPDWHLPVGAVLDALGLDGVTLVGISLGGCLALRAAAVEPRIARVVAFDVLRDYAGCIRAQLDPLTRALLRAAIAVGARQAVNRFSERIARREPLREWALSQAMRVFGRETPFDALAAGSAFHTRDVSALVRQDVLLLAGAEDHYVPVSQLWDQARALTRARSVTCRLFTRAEHAQAHCQVGNLPLAIATCAAWIDGLTARGAG